MACRSDGAKCVSQSGGLEHDHNASTEDSSRMELRIDVFQEEKSMKERKVDIEVSTIIGIETKIANQVSSWRPAGITWVTLEPNTADDLSWDRTKARSLAGGIAIYLVLDKLDFAYDIEELIKRIGHGRVAENLNNTVMNSTNSEVNSEEPECVWTVFSKQ